MVESVYRKKRKFQSELKEILKGNPTYKSKH